MDGLSLKAQDVKKKHVSLINHTVFMSWNILNIRSSISFWSVCFTWSTAGLLPFDWKALGRFSERRMDQSAWFSAWLAMTTLRYSILDFVHIQTCGSQWNLGLCASNKNLITITILASHHYEHGIMNTNYLSTHLAPSLKQQETNW